MAQKKYYYGTQKELAKLYARKVLGLDGENGRQIQRYIDNPGIAPIEAHLLGTPGAALRYVQRQRKAEQRATITSPSGKTFEVSALARDAIDKGGISGLNDYNPVSENERSALTAYLTDIADWQEAQEEIDRKYNGLSNDERNLFSRYGLDPASFNEVELVKLADRLGVDSKYLRDKANGKFVYDPDTVGIDMTAIEDMVSPHKPLPPTIEEYARGVLNTTKWTKRDGSKATDSDIRALEALQGVLLRQEQAKYAKEAPIASTFETIIKAPARGIRSMVALGEDTVNTAKSAISGDALKTAQGIFELSPLALKMLKSMNVLPAPLANETITRANSLSAQVGESQAARNENYNALTDNPINVNAPSRRLSNETATIRDVVTNEYAKKWFGGAEAPVVGNIGQFLYQTTTSTGDSLMDMAIASAVAGGFGAGAGAGAEAGAGAGAATSKIMSGITAGMMSAEAGSNDVADKIKAGETALKALGRGTITAIIEYLSEKWGLEKILNEPKTIVGGLLKSALYEGSEEVASNWANKGVDAMFFRSDSDIIKRVEELRKNGNSTKDAVKQATVESLTDDAAAFLGGALSGFAFGGFSGAQAYGRYAQNAYRNGASRDAVRQTKADYAKGVVESGMQSPEGTASRNLAEKLNKKIEKGKTPSAYQVMRLQNENIEQIENEEQAIAKNIDVGAGYVFVNPDSNKRLTVISSDGKTSVVRINNNSYTATVPIEQVQRQIYSEGMQRLRADGTTADVITPAETAAQTDEAFSPTEKTSAAERIKNAAEAVRGVLVRKNSNNSAGEAQQVADNADVDADNTDISVNGQEEASSEIAKELENLEHNDIDAQNENTDDTSRVNGDNLENNPIVSSSDTQADSSDTTHGGDIDFDTLSRVLNSKSNEQNSEDDNISETSENDTQAEQGNTTLSVMSENEVSAGAESENAVEDVMRGVSRNANTETSIKAGETYTAMRNGNKITILGITGGRTTIGVNNSTVRVIPTEAVEKAIASGALANVKNDVKQGDSVTELSDAERAALNNLSRVFGVKIVTTPTIDEGTKNGFYKDGVIYLALDADDKISAIASHELLHHIAKVSPKEYRKYKSLVLGIIDSESEQGLKYERDKYTALARRHGVELSRAEVDEELVAEYTQGIINDTAKLNDFIEKVRERSNEPKSIFRSLAAALRSLLDKIKRLAGGSSEMRGLAERMQRAYDTLVSAAAVSSTSEQQSNITQSGPETSEGKEKFSFVGKNADGADIAAEERRDTFPESMKPNEDVVLAEKARMGYAQNPTDPDIIEARSKALFTEKNRESITTKLKKATKEISKIGIVAELTGNEFKKGDKSLLQQVGKFFKQIGNKAVNPQIGEVALTEQGVRSSIAHGIGRNKAIAFAAVPNVIEKGKIIDYVKDWKGRGYATYVIAAPIMIGNNMVHVGVVVSENKETRRYYLHEVITKDVVPFKTGRGDNSLNPSGATSVDNNISQSDNIVKDNIRENSGNDTKFSLRKADEINQEDIRAVQSIGRKSVNEFTQEDIAKTESFARKYFKEMGVKSPFFRAWFGDWRANDKTIVHVATKKGAERGVTRNTDTGWDIQVSGKVFTETRVHTHNQNLAARPYLEYINGIVENAVLLDSYAVPESKAKSPNSVMMHSFYALADIGNGAELLKLYVEEMHNPNKDDTDKRSYQLQNISKTPNTNVSGNYQRQSDVIGSESTSLPAPSEFVDNQRLSAKGSGSASLAQSPQPLLMNYTVSDLFSLVKSHDKNFSPKLSSKVVNEDGTPRVVYHGTDADFTVFDRTKGRSSMNIQGMFFSPWEIDAGGYGEKTGAYYLDIKNPAKESVAYKALNMFIGQNDAGTKAREYLERQGYDGVNNNDEEYIAFYPEQIKSATDNIGTFDAENDDIRYSLKRGAGNIENNTADKIFEADSDALEKFAGQIDTFMRGRLKKSDTLSLGQTPEILKQLKAKSLPVVMSQDVLIKITGGKHSISTDEIKKLPSEIANPLMVFDSATVKGAFVILTELTDKEGNEVIVALHLGRRADHINVNRIATVFGKKNIENFIKAQTRDGNLRYIDKKRSQEWSQRRGLQLPKRADTTLDSNNSILTKEDIVKMYYTKNSENDTHFSLKRDTEFETQRKIIDFANDINNDDLLELAKRNKRDFATIYKKNTELMARLNRAKAQIRKTGGARPDPKATARITREIIKKFDSKINVRETAERVYGVYSRYYKKIKNSGNVSVFEKSAIDDMWEAFSDIAKDIIENAEIMPISEDYISLYRYLKAQPITVSDTIKSDITDYESFRKANFGRLNLKKEGGAPVDTVYAELAGMFPGFFPDTIVNPTDQLMMIADTIKELKPEAYNPYIENIQETMDEVIACFVSAADGLPAETTQMDKAINRLREQVKREYGFDKVDEDIKRLEGRIDGMRIRRRRAEYRASIRKTATELGSMALGTRGKLPKELIKAAAETASLVDLHTDRVLKNGEETKTSMYLDTLKARYDAIKDDPDYDIASEYDEALSARIGALGNMLSGRKVIDLSVYELSELDSMLKQIKHILQNAKKQIGIDEARSNYDLGMKWIEELKEQPRIDKNIARRFLSQITSQVLNPMRVGEMIGGFNENSVAKFMFNQLSNGVHKQDRFIMDASRPFDRLRDGAANAGLYNEWLTTPINTGMKYSDGSDVVLTKNMLCNLLLLWERPQGRRHLETGGFTVPNIKYFNKGDYARAFAEGQKTRGWVNAADIEKLRGLLDEYDEKWLSSARHFFREVSTDAINETSMLLVGRKIANDEKYIRIYTDKNFLRTENEGLKMDATIEGNGSLKSILPQAKQPLYLYGLAFSVSDHMNFVAKYNGLAIPIRNFNKVFGVNSVLQDNADRESVKKALAEKWGVGIRDGVIGQMLTDLQTPRRRATDPMSRALGALQSNWVAATLNFNISVSMKQFASFPTAGAVIGFKPLVKAMASHRNLGELFDEIDEHTGIHYKRRLGLSTQELGDRTITNSAVKRATETIENVANKKLRIPKGAIPSNWIQTVDVWTTAKLWEASKYYVEEQLKLSPRNKEYWNEVTRVYENVIESTQPNYDILHRPEIQKSTNTLLRSLIMFQTQPLQNTGILYASMLKMRAAREQLNVNLNNKEARQAYNTAKAQAAQSLASLAVSALMFVLMTAAASFVKHSVDKWRDDEDKVSVQKYAVWYIQEFAKQGFNMLVPAIGTPILDAFGRIFGGEGYEMDTPITSLINDTVDSIESIVFAVKKITGEDSYKSGREKIATLLKGTNKLLKNLSVFCGVPLQNAENLFKGISGYVTDIKHGQLFSEPADYYKTSYVYSYSDLSAAILSGNAKKEAKIKKYFDDCGRETKSATLTKYIKPAYQKYFADDAQRAASISKKLIEQYGYTDEDICKWVHQSLADAIISGDEAQEKKIWNAIKNSPDISRFIKNKSVKNPKYQANLIASYVKSQYLKEIENNTQEAIRLKNKLIEAYGVEEKRIKEWSE